MVSRRKFIQQSSFLASALMVNKTDLFKMHTDVGLQLYTVRNEIKDLKNTLQKIYNTDFFLCTILFAANRAAQY